MKTEGKNFFELSEEDLQNVLTSYGLENISESYMMVNGELMPPIQEPDAEEPSEFKCPE